MTREEVRAAIAASDAEYVRCVSSKRRSSEAARIAAERAAEATLGPDEELVYPDDVTAPDVVANGVMRVRRVRERAQLDDVSDAERVAVELPGRK